MTDQDQEDIILEESEEEPVKKKGKLMLFLIIILVVLGVGAGGGYYFFGNRIMKMLPFGSSSPQEGEKGKEKAKDKEKVKEAKHEPGVIVPLEPFVFNVAGNPSKFAKVSLGVELKDAKVAEEAKKIVPAMRDRILLVLGTKPAEVFLDVSQRDTIKSEVQETLKVLFKEKDELNTVYITDIIIQ